MIVNKDAIRTMLYGRYAYKKNFEDVVKNIARYSILMSLQFGCDVIIDETNVSRDSRENLVKMIRQYFDKVHCRIVYRVFPKGKECLERRLLDPRDISEKTWREVHQDMMDRWEDPTREEEFDEIVYEGMAVKDSNAAIRFMEHEQMNLCKTLRVPCFVPRGGLCIRCKKNVYAHETVKANYSKEHITGCPHCGHSFVE
jgi:predicted kinase